MPNTPVNPGADDDEEDEEDGDGDSIVSGSGSASGTGSARKKRRTSVSDVRTFSNVVLFRVIRIYHPSPRPRFGHQVNEKHIVKTNDDGLWGIVLAVEDGQYKIVEISADGLTEYAPRYDDSRRARSFESSDTFRSA